jgi:hypothetical protein
MDDTDVLSNMIGFGFGGLLTLYFTFNLWQLISKLSQLLNRGLKIFLIAYNLTLILLAVIIFIPGIVKRIIVNVCHIIFLSIFFIIIY